jgi:hypothetical protein
MNVGDSVHIDIADGILFQKKLPAEVPKCFTTIGVRITSHADPSPFYHYGLMFVI